VTYKHAASGAALTLLFFVRTIRGSGAYTRPLFSST